MVMIAASADRDRADHRDRRGRRRRGLRAVEPGNYVVDHWEHRSSGLRSRRLGRRPVAGRHLVGDRPRSRHAAPPTGATHDDHDRHPPEPQVRAVEILTDEELSLLTYGPGAVVTPYFSTVAARDTELAQRTAYRSLVARGIVDPTGTPGDGPVRLLLREDVMTLVTLRQSATTLVAVARTMTDSQDFWYAHVVEDLVVLEEVSDDGLHRFALAFTRDLPALLVDAALHPDASRRRPARRSIDAMPDDDAPAQLLEVLGRAHVRADVVVLDADDA